MRLYLFFSGGGPAAPPMPFRLKSEPGICQKKIKAKRPLAGFRPSIFPPVEARVNFPLKSGKPRHKGLALFWLFPAFRRRLPRPLSKKKPRGCGGGRKQALRAKAGGRLIFRPLMPIVSKQALAAGKPARGSRLRRKKAETGAGKQAKSGRRKKRL